MCRSQQESTLKVTEDTQNGALKLRYSGLPLVNVRGPVTGIIYRFSPAQPVQPVDARDGQLLLASQLFRQTL
jgi:hypothetical protein